jgi:demethylmenaquinone methyltransferase/2-methoxy-6-polyprenyl-1,4-benzoquinol methylase
MPLPLLDHFGLLAPYYDRIFQVNDLGPLVSWVAPEASHRLLDIGGGTGRIAQRFCGCVAQVCVIDPSPEMLRQVRDKCPSARSLDSTQAESETLPFADGVFDRIIVVDAFHHLRDQALAASEMVRVLAPGGRLVIQEPDIAHWGVKLVALGERALLMRSRFYAPEDIRAMYLQHEDVAQATLYRTHIEPAAESIPGATAWVVIDKE